MDHSPSEPNKSSKSLEITRILFYPAAQYRDHSRPPPLQSKSPSTPSPFIQNSLPNQCNKNVYCSVMQGTKLWQLLTVGVVQPGRSATGTWTCPVQYGRLWNTRQKVTQPFLRHPWSRTRS